MKWIDDFQLFLFDLDGLLVNTEIIHFQAYINMLKRRGFNLDWTFLKFCEVAHFDDESLKDGVYALFPDLFDQESNWQVLRKEKNLIYIDLLKSSKVNLLKGVEKILIELERKNKKRCVVTNSTKLMTDIIKSKQLLLEKIPNWITREDYLSPKPNPDCYLHAISLFAKKGDRIIGFEDSLRGIKALQQTPAFAVLIGQPLDPRADSVLSKEMFHFASFDDIPDNFL